MNLADLLSRTATAHGHRIAVELGDHSLTYNELDTLAGRVAALLTARGVTPGDRVGLMLPNLLEFPALYYGTLRAGAVVVPMNPLLKSREVAHYLGDSGAVLLFAFAPVVEEATAGAQGTAADVVPVGPGSLTQLLAAHPVPAPEPSREEQDTAVILYTSGTTGVPKGAELTHANLVRNSEIIATPLLRLSPEDVLLGCLPLFHAFGQTCAMNAAVTAGARLTLMPRFDPALALQTIQQRQVTIFQGVPTMYAAMLAAHAQQPGTYDASSLRLCASGGASLPVEVLHGFEAAFDCPVLEGFGMSETSPVASFNHPNRPRKAGSIGTPIEGVELCLIDEKDGVGELCVRGHNIMKGYWGRPEATAETIVDGWLRTGDLATVDKDGYYFIVDRKKDLVIRGGYNVYPREIEEVLHEHPAVAEAAVIGIPHPTLGEDVAAAVALHPGNEATAVELREFVRARVAPYKYPREVWILDALPKGATGKILKREIPRALPEDTRP
ncbi:MULTISPECIES: long-chain-fatty-acid--CoA ligase [unclassified Streptomyces]|uniref:long-chain-fatty-acid--CoA ligase n=1 Tax=unclassified Streptomyces TaxID=2593676 RepID=UPI002DD91040|nr:long-chain fatty acid--CoA ligase [Streptomyces sp. NBC_01761]WSC51661.1 long-chain fatty acid--CoA ligase [Streptomyces sp. NBC_01761]WSF82511.1 long-chain fatty acid--CoA ligase [Streptomyces sp. NBC_01744]